MYFGIKLLNPQACGQPDLERLNSHGMIVQAWSTTKGDRLRHDVNLANPTIFIRHQGSHRMRCKEERLLHRYVLRRSLNHTSTAAQKLDKRLRKELLVWKSLQHKHVLPLIGIIRDFGPHVSMHGVNLDLRRRLQLVREVASGLAYLHSKEVVHGDLTGYNILLDKNDRIHISDFGFATIAAQFRDTSLDSSSVSGAIRWMDPVYSRIRFLITTSRKNPPLSYNSRNTVILTVPITHPYRKFTGT
ncbi:hypothetical protein ONZ45_g6289 [Pleurotus djamor]|nr:hypothetical protein ONZ45_g6289 [Pleurotus djamor]